MANQRPTLYVGVTDNIVKRGYQHKEELVIGFTKKYHLHKLVYYESVEGEFQAIGERSKLKI